MLGINESLSFQLMPDHLPALQLMILLLTSNHDYEKALDVTDQTLEEYPENLSLMTLKVRLQEITDGPEAALNTAKGKLFDRANIHFYTHKTYHIFSEQIGL